MKSIPVESKFLIAVPNETSTDLERYADQIDRQTTVISRLIGKDTSFFHPPVQNIFSTLMQLCADYDTAKDKVSNEIVLPLAKERWGEKASVNWSIEFASQNMTVTFSGFDERVTETIDVKPDDAFVAEQRKLSVMRTALADVYDRILQTNPTLDNQAFTELVAEIDRVETAYNNNIKFINSQYVKPWFDANRADASEKSRSWNLFFEDGHIEVSYLKA